MTTTFAEVTTAPARKERERSAWSIYIGTVSTTVTVILAMVAAVTIVIAVASRLSPKGQYTIFGHPAMIVVSGSMSPTIKTGDFIIDNRVSPAQAEHLRVGQIVSFRESAASTTVLTHRIVGVQTVDGHVEYTTKGDVNNAADQTRHTPAEVVGVYRFNVHRGGYFLKNLHKPQVLGLLLASPVLWFMAAPLYNFARGADDDEPAAEPRRDRRRHAHGRHSARGRRAAASSLKEGSSR